MAGDLTRRAALGLLGAGSILSVSQTRGFSQFVAGRSANVSLADDPANALVGIDGLGPVKKNSREAMAEFLNNASDTMTITVSLDTASDGTLYDNEGESGSSVAFTVDPGNSQFVDLKAAVTGTIPYSVTVSSPSLSLQTTGSVESQTGNVRGAVVVHKPSKDGAFTASTGNQRFEVQSVDVRDEQSPNDLDRIEFRVKEGGSGGTVVGSLDVTDPPSDRYNPKGNPAVTIQPDSGYRIAAGTTYQLTVRGFDAGGNSDASTVEDTT